MCELPVKGLCLVGTFVSSGSVLACLLVCFVPRLVAVILDVCRALRNGDVGIYIDSVCLVRPRKYIQY